jgi:hypothetical protein
LFISCEKKRIFNRKANKLGFSLFLFFSLSPSFLLSLSLSPSLSLSFSIYIYRPFFSSSRSFDFVDKLIAIVVETCSLYFFFLSLSGSHLLLPAMLVVPFTPASYYTFWTKLSFGVTLLQLDHLVFP